jgi:hypothetical protein
MTEGQKSEWTQTGGWRRHGGELGAATHRARCEPLATTHLQQGPGAGRLPGWASAPASARG